MRSKESFNKAAKLYDEVRPTYPNEVINQIIKETNITTDNELLEIAPGTGQATLRFAEKGFKIHAVELGDKLAELLRENTKEYEVTVDVSPFETWERETPQTYKMIYCATAFHWIDPDIKYSKTASLLEEEGYLVLLWNNPIGTDNQIINEAYRLLFSYYYNRPHSTKARTEQEVQEQKQHSINVIEESGYYNVTNIIEHEWTAIQSREKTIKGFYSQSSYLSLDDTDKLELTTQLENIFSQLQDEIPTTFVTSAYICRKRKGV